MKKTIRLMLKIILIISILISICPKAYAKDNPTIKDIVDLFNVCKVVKKYNQEGTITLSASTYIKDAGTSSSKTYLRIHIDDEFATTDLDYTVEGNVITADYVGGDTRVRQYWEQMTEILVDCISQFHGYAEGEMFDTLRTPGIVNYTLDEEGLRIETNSENNYYAQIDIAKIIPIIDTNSYIKEADLESVANNISGDGIAKYKKGNIIFYKCTINDKDIITIGELNDFTYKIDKSIYNIIKVMFESSSPAEYFKTNYPTVDVDKQFKGVTIEVNPIKNDTEQHVFSGENNYKFVRITIDRKAVNEALNPTTVSNPTPVNPTPSPVTSEPTNPTSSTPEKSTGSGNTGTLPNTGKEINWVVMSLYGVFSVAVLGIILVKLNKKEA